MNDPDQAEYMQAIEYLQPRASEAVAAATQLEEGMPEGAYPLRWSLYYILAELNSPATINLFEQTASQDLAEAPDPDGTACHPPGDGKVLVSMMAVEGIQRLLDSEPRSAAAALERVIRTQPCLAVRRAAFHALVTAQPEKRGDALEWAPDQREKMPTRGATIGDFTAPLFRLREGVG